jgi:hypothetical protein
MWGYWRRFGCGTGGYSTRIARDDGICNTESSSHNGQQHGTEGIFFRDYGNDAGIPCFSQDLGSLRFLTGHQNDALGVR